MLLITLIIVRLEQATSHRELDCVFESVAKSIPPSIQPMRGYADRPDVR